MAGSSTWMMRQPAASRSATSCRSASPIWKACSERGMSLRGKDQLMIVTGPVSMPLTKARVVMPCASLNSCTVMGASRTTSPAMMGGRT